MARKIRVELSIREMRDLKSSEKSRDTAILDLLETKTQTTALDKVRDSVARGLNTASRTVSTKSK